ncbi:WD repeat-containing protein [Escovopsis weberi]|uniref:WD repeat-containing protein n=1 Tax=Escovopsis weberi TaxID=150374 RepID=A0A0M8N7R4_ESCWE|nr:WD repeat-containing protein [Escovopsis weberi]
MAKKEGEGLSAFERRRLENMAVNKAILSDISAAAQKIIPEAPIPKKAAPKRKTVKVETVNFEPRRSLRKSSRLAGLDAADGTLKRKLEVEAEHEAEKAKLKKMRNADDLNLGDIAVDGRKYGHGVAAVQELFRGAQPGVRTFTEDDVKETTDKGLKELRLRMGGLKLYEQWAPNGSSLSALR